MKYTKTQTQEALDTLKEVVFPGDTIHTIVTHKSGGYALKQEWL